MWLEQERIQQLVKKDERLINGTAALEQDQCRKDSNGWHCGDN